MRQRTCLHCNADSIAWSSRPHSLLHICIKHNIVNYMLITCGGSTCAIVLTSAFKEYFAICTKLSTS